MSKRILFNAEAREKLRKGVNALADAVKETLGAKGKTVMISRGFNNPHVTKDGVTVARSIELEDVTENMGAMVLKEASSNTAEEAGDGTTSSSVIGQAIINAGLDQLSKGANPIDIKRGIDKAVKVVVSDLKGQSDEVGDDMEKIMQVASISANNDEEIGALITEAINKVGTDGVVTIEPAFTTEVKVAEGMQFDRGYISPYFSTNQEKMTSELKNPYILVCDRKILNIQDLLPVFGYAHQNGGRPILVIAEEIGGDAAHTMVVNKMNGKLNACAVNAPQYGERMKEILADIAAVVGADVVSDELDRNLTQFNPEWLGQAKSVTVSRKNTIITGGDGEEEKVKERADGVRAQLDSTVSKANEEYLKTRLAKLVSGVAVINVSANSEVELKEKIDRVDDALWATRSAIEEGVVAGGGVALLRARKSLDGIKGDNSDQNKGIQIVKTALTMPFKQIVANSTGEYVDTRSRWWKRKTKAHKIMEAVDKNSNPSFGYNVRTGEYEDLIQSGVIDPSKVSRVALENAASVAGTLLTTDCVVVEKIEEK